MSFKVTKISSDKRMSDTESETSSSNPSGSSEFRGVALCDKEATLACRKHYAASTMVKEVMKYVRSDLFPLTKFPPCDEYCSKMVLHTKKQFRVPIPDNVTQSFFADYWGGVLKKNITLCRHNAQTLARKNFLGKSITV